MFSTDSLRGQQIVLAGGAGGIGSAVAAALHQEGAQLVISYHTQAGRAQPWAGRATVVRADIGKSEDRKRLLDAAPAIYGVVALAGDPVRDQSLQRSHDVNYAGPILLAREAADRMRAASKPGAIVLISTMQANALFPGSTVYAAQKAALQHAGLILAKELRGKSGIRVNMVSPGITAAGMAEASIASGKYDRFIDEGVIARFGRAQDVARAIRFFLEPDNYVTGQVLCVDGGITL